MIKVNIQALGIIDQDQKDWLEDNSNGFKFKQRKNYSEYYANSSHVELEESINLLHAATDYFLVTVAPNELIFEHK